MMPMFSIIHTSARPHKWREIYDAWMANCDDTEGIEYVLVIDPRWGFDLDPALYVGSSVDNIVVVQNTGRRCYVDGVNLGAKASSGKILIVNADDQYPCKHWDTMILASALERANGPSGLSVPFVIEVSTGTPDEHQRGIMVMPILSRGRYQDQNGCVFYPEYESMFADNDFCEWARKDGVVIDARGLVFPHKHWQFNQEGQWISGKSRSGGLRAMDDVDLVQARKEAYALGSHILDQRRACGFNSSDHPRSIALCLSGENLHRRWVNSILDLQAHLIARGFELMRVWGSETIGYTTNVYVTREQMRRAIVNADQKPDLALWIDDDNPLTPAQFDQLLMDLDSHPEVDGVSGWCWIHTEAKTNFMVSCGLWSPDHLHWDPFPTNFARETEPRPFETGGLPCMLMSLSALEKAGDGAFLPTVDNRLEHGITGEDLSFFLHAERGGAKFLVDPKVRVPHLKIVEVIPEFPAEPVRTPVKVACMIRAKNEGRWIARAIRSVKPLCHDDVYVMEDGSIDDTVVRAMDAGAHVVDSPFVGRGLDERRDKNWFLKHVKNACKPDWIIMIDGDEELEPGGCDKIRAVLETNPPVDCFSVRFLYFWDSFRTIRVDGVYNGMMRQSVFRADSDLEFKSFYEGDGKNTNHVGLHVSNAPGLGNKTLRVAPLNVFLYHYGYVHKMDRIRKYNWITKLDPDNEAEDFYLHMIQGDVSSVPADARLKHGGPLQLKRLPDRLIPKFEGQPPLAWQECGCDARYKICSRCATIEELNELRDSLKIIGRELEPSRKYSIGLATSDPDDVIVAVLEPG
jgi:glycosyltransferase involved in cell wall biosynthesis